jgi:hypothetical protein
MAYFHHQQEHPWETKETEAVDRKKIQIETNEKPEISRRREKNRRKFPVQNWNGRN